MNPRELFKRKLTIGTTIAAIEVNNDTYCLQKMNGKVPLEPIAYLYWPCVSECTMVTIVYKRNWVSLK